jgi:chromate transporter
MQHDLSDSPRRNISKAELFFGFLKIGLLGFGGIAPWARHIIVEEKRWLSDREFAELLGVGQVLPGPNVMNASILIGDRNQGLIGVVLCLLGQLAMPLAIVVALAVVYERVAAVPEVNAALIGAAAASAGLVLGTALKMVRNIRPTLLPLGIGAAGFAAIGLLRWPLVPVVLVLVPLAIAATWLGRRK